MDVNSIAQRSSSLTAQSNAVELTVATLKQGNNQMKAEGAAVLKLIGAVPQAVGNVGNTINTTV